MIRIHVLDVEHGDSLVIESHVEGQAYWSIIDCCEGKNSIPTIDFLKKHNIKALEAIFLSHLHHDHVSGIPDLVDYLVAEGVTVKNFFSPIRKDEWELGAELFEAIYPRSDEKNVKSLEKALHALAAIIGSAGMPQKFTLSQAADWYQAPWTTEIHPGLEMAFLNPPPGKLREYFGRPLKSSNPKYPYHNDLSHVILARIPGHEEVYLFTGDLDTKHLSNVTALAEKAVGGNLNGKVRFIKAPHHGTFPDSVRELLNSWTNTTDKSMVTVSCMSDKKHHPSPELICYMKDERGNCDLACTGMSSYCISQIHKDQDNKSRFGLRPERDKVKSVIEMAGSKAEVVPISRCHGNISFEHSGESDYTFTSESKNGCFIR